MCIAVVIQGRTIGVEEMDLVRQLLVEHPDWSRTRLSRELCAAWAWHNERGQYKDMACRTLLLKFERRGWISLLGRALRRTAPSTAPGADTQR